jgi:hypothetical protein
MSSFFWDETSDWNRDWATRVADYYDLPFYWRP